MSEDATTSQVASTCLQIEYDCIVVLFLFPLGGVGGDSSKVPDLMNRVCVCVCIRMPAVVRSSAGGEGV